ncbi:MAG: hypothetical protein AB7N80_03775 [Bdellovibrionales bacterium]
MHFIKAHKQISAAVFIVLALCQAARAEDPCDILLGAGQQIRFGSSEGPLEGLKYRDVANLIDLANRALGPDFRLPSPISVHMQPRGFQAQYMLLPAPQNPILLLNSVHTSLDGRTANTHSQGQGVVLHEYTHLIYETNLRADLPEFFTAYQKLDDAVFAGYMEEPVSEETLCLAERRNSLKHMLTSYSELFADVVPVLAAEDLKVISKGIYFPGETDPTARLVAMARDYSVIHDFTTWAVAEPHIILAPLGGHISRQALTGPDSGAHKQRTARRLYLAILSEIRARETSGNLQAEVGEMNVNLLRAFEKQSSR